MEKIQKRWEADEDFFVCPLYPVEDLASYIPNDAHGIFLLLRSEPKQAKHTVILVDPRPLNCDLITAIKNVVGLPQVRDSADTVAYKLVSLPSNGTPPDFLVARYIEAQKLAEKHKPVVTPA